jgi:hypothetical protein
MSHHIPDLTKMIGDTPISDSTPHNVAELGMLCRRLERQLNEVTKERDDAVFVTEKVLRDFSEHSRSHCKALDELVAANDRIKRLEEAGDAILNATGDDEEYEAMKQWHKAKEDKL